MSDEQAARVLARAAEIDQSHKNGPVASKQGDAVPEGHEDATSARGADL